jgi:hypothetical protein
MTMQLLELKEELWILSIIFFALHLMIIRSAGNYFQS